MLYSMTNYIFKIILLYRYNIILFYNYDTKLYLYIHKLNVVFKKRSKTYKNSCLLIIIIF